MLIVSAPVNSISQEQSFNSELSVIAIAGRYFSIQYGVLIASNNNIRSRKLINRVVVASQLQEYPRLLFRKTQNTSLCGLSFRYSED